MAQSQSFDTGHTEMIHDCQLDFFSKYVATASQDRSVKIFDLTGDSGPELVAEVSLHTGPVFSLSWAHPRHGKLLASCGYDGQIIICSFDPDSRNLSEAHSDRQREGQVSINCVQWAPEELFLAAGCSDGTLVWLQRSDEVQQWESSFLPECHVGGVNGVAFCPESIRGETRLATCGCDNTVKILHFDRAARQFKEEQRLIGHMNWVRSVAWAPITGPDSTSIVASGAEDKSVIIWKCRNRQWKKQHQIPVESEVWGVSWSPMGNLLAVSHGENRVSLFKEDQDGVWNRISDVREPAV